MNPQTDSALYPRSAVGAVVIERGRLLLVQRSKEPHLGCWAVPGGKIRWGETLRDAVIREVMEETGLIVDVDDVVWVGEKIEPPGAFPAHHNVLVDFSATVVGGELRAGSDAASARFVPLAEARTLPLTPTMYELLDTIDPPPVYYVTPPPDRADCEHQARRPHVSQTSRSL